MTDQSAYVNAYLENTVAMLHDQLNQIIQLKTQIKLSENLLSQKDSKITELSSQITTTSATEKEFAVLKEKLRMAEDSNHGLLNKLSHMETLQNQFNVLKKQLLEKEKDQKKASTKKVINKDEEKVLITNEPAPSQHSNKKSDDF